MSPPKTVLYLIVVGRRTAKQGNAWWGYAIRGEGHWLKNLLWRYARWKGSPGTLKSWITQTAAPITDENFLASKKAIIYMKNEDEECFKWCITIALNPAESHSERITKALREQAEKLDWSGIELTVAADANIINKFERNNDISVNVFGYERVIFPIYVSKRLDDKIPVVDLLLTSDDIDKKHYCWIKNFNRLMALRTEKSHNSMH